MPGAGEAHHTTGKMFRGHTAREPREPAGNFANKKKAIAGKSDSKDSVKTCDTIC